VKYKRRQQKWHKEWHECMKATINREAMIVYNRISKGTLKCEVEEQTKQKWQKECN
jgi:hypothetical protein